MVTTRNTGRTGRLWPDSPVSKTRIPERCVGLIGLSKTIHDSPWLIACLVGVGWRSARDFTVPANVARVGTTRRRFERSPILNTVFILSPPPQPVPALSRSFTPFLLLPNGVVFVVFARNFCRPNDNNGRQFLQLFIPGRCPR